MVAALLTTALAAMLLGRAAGVVRRAATRRPPLATDGRVHGRATVLAERVRRCRTRRLRRRGRAPSAEAVASWCDELSRRMRSGATLRDALANATGTTALEEVIGRIQLRLERGASVEEALAHAAGGARPGRWLGRQRSDESAVGPLALASAVIATSASLGGANAQALDRAAAALRLRVADGQERAAHSAQARMSAHVLTLVPLGFLVMMVTIDPNVRGAVASPSGAAIVAVGLLLNGAGWLWMRTVIGAAT